MKAILAVLLLLAVADPAIAQLTVAEPWVRATVAGQGATGAFMQLRATQDVKVVAARSPVAGVVEIHEMKMEGGVMTMGAIPELAVRAGKTVELKPGGYHVMLMDLKKAVREGDVVPITLVVEGANRKRKEVEVQAKVRSTTAAGHGH